jgi:hypothetical protein
LRSLNKDYIPGIKIAQSSGQYSTPPVDMTTFKAVIDAYNTAAAAAQHASVERMAI